MEGGEVTRRGAGIGVRCGQVFIGRLRKILSVKFVAAKKRNRHKRWIRELGEPLSSALSGMGSAVWSAGPPDYWDLFYPS